MFNDIDFNVIFPYVVVLQWTIINTIETFIVLILLLCCCIEIVLLYCDFIVFTGCIDMEYKKIREKAIVLYWCNYW
jgi:hypothetical protein